ncbi:helix-hairpin-helix domain-containing protein [uncultured Granulicatella sp.]|uniref:helix-hairpin-helix domain-containing protein n=1 Tax=uncultured Granulicatella sp. TaxID=316089 RepID=UPI0028D67C1C|nr:helix-hairpin-helix domain-containing protein [uncultured Granulicatella sp.]
MMFYFFMQVKCLLMEYKKILSIIGGVLAVIVIILVGRGMMASPTKEKVMVTNAVNTTRVEETTTMIPQNCYVDIKGEVLRPGVYEFSCESRIQEVIKKAGGFTEEADETKINLAQKITDQMQLIVPNVYSKQEGGVTEGNSEKGNSSNSTPSNSKKGTVNINTATLEELQTIKGIGKKKAEAILQYRKEHGAFRTKEDLLQVKGIGKKALEAIESQVTFQ